MHQVAQKFSGKVAFKMKPHIFDYPQWISLSFPFIILLLKMQQQNHIKPSLHNQQSNSIYVQTQEFLLYLSIQSKLSTLLEQYSCLQQKYKQTQDQLQYQLFKNKILENSLYQLTFNLNNRLSETKINSLDQMKRLDIIIEKEKREAKKLQNEVKQMKESLDILPSQRYSKIASKNCSKSQATVLESQAQIKTQRKRQILSDVKTLAQKSPVASIASRNELLDSSLPNTTAIQFRVPSNNPSLQKSFTARSIKDEQLEYLQKKYDKQNFNIEKMMKKEAEMNLKSFLKMFQTQRAPTTRRLF